MGEVWIPNDWDNETYKCYSVMWPSSFGWLSVLNGLIDQAGTGWFWNEDTGNVVEARDAVRATWEYNFTNEEVIMACNDETLEILTGIKDALDALVAKPCCPPVTSVGGGSAGAGLVEGPPSTTENTPESREGPPPPGFDSWSEFDTYQCDAASYILDQMIADIATMGLLSAGISSGVALATLLVAALLTPIGWAVLISVATIFLGLLVTGIEISELTSLLEDNKDDLVCAMLLGHDVGSSINSYND